MPMQPQKRNERAISVYQSKGKYPLFTSLYTFAYKQWRASDRGKRARALEVSMKFIFGLDFIRHRMCSRILHFARRQIRTPYYSQHKYHITKHVAAIRRTTTTFK